MMPTIKLDKNKGIVFWITGLSGSGKTTIGKKIKTKIIKNYGLIDDHIITNTSVKSPLVTSTILIVSIKNSNY